MRSPRPSGMRARELPSLGKCYNSSLLIQSFPILFIHHCLGMIQILVFLLFPCTCCQELTTTPTRNSATLSLFSLCHCHGPASAFLTLIQVNTVNIGAWLTSLLVHPRRHQAAFLSHPKSFLPPHHQPLSWRRTSTFQSSYSYSSRKASHHQGPPTFLKESLHILTCVTSNLPAGSN